MRFFIAVLFTLLATPAFSQVRINTFSELLQYADNIAPAALQAKLQPLAAKQDVNIQASGLYPRINVFGNGDYYPLIPVLVVPAEFLRGAPGTFTTAQLGLPYVFSTGAELSMPLINFEKWAQLAKARALYNQAQWSSKSALEQFHIQLMQSYYQTLVTKEILELNNENAETATELSRIMDERNKNGVVNPSDYNRSKNLELDVRSAGLNYQRQLNESVTKISTLLNIKDSLALNESVISFNWPVVPNASDPSFRPAWKEADYKLGAAALALTESKRGGLPRLSLAGRYAYNFQSKFETGSNHVEFNTANIGARIDFPLFQGTYYRSMINKNSVLLENARLEQQRIQASLSQQQKDWYMLYNTAYDKHTLLNDKVKNAGDNLRIARLNIKEGIMEFDEFNNIFIEYNRARMEYLQNLADGILYYLLSTQNL